MLEFFETRRRFDWPRLRQGGWGQGPGCIVASILYVLLAASAVHAQEDAIETSHRGVRLIGFSVNPKSDFDVEIMSAGQAIEQVRLALNLLEETSPFSATALTRLKDSGQVTIVYDPSFPPMVASRAGTELAAFVSDPDAEESTGNKQFRAVVGRYIVKWDTEGLASALVHELVGHGMQHLNGRLHTLQRLDVECEAYLYTERFFQDLGINKHSRVVVAFRQALQWRWCVPFRQYMMANTPSQMELWNTLNPDVPQLLLIFDEYLQGE